MKNSDNILYYVIAAVVILAALYIMSRPKSQAPVQSASADEKPWTVYGSKNCGWTNKQLKHLDEKNIPYKFVDCDSEDCGQIAAFPTNVKPDGSRAVGFIEVA
jgi:glutaredoxin